MARGPLLVNTKADAPGRGRLPPDHKKIQNMIYDIFNPYPEFTAQGIREALGEFMYYDDICTKFGNESETHAVAVFRHGKALLSYDSIVGIYLFEEGVFVFTPKHDYSRTTKEYMHRWTGLSAGERRRMIKDGDAHEVDLTRAWWNS